MIWLLRSQATLLFLYHKRCVLLICNGTSCVGLLVWTLSLNHCKTIQCFNLLSSCTEPQGCCCEQSEQQQTCTADCWISITVNVMDDSSTILYANSAQLFCKKRVAQVLMTIKWATSFRIVTRYNLLQSSIPTFLGFESWNSKLWIKGERSSSPLQGRNLKKIWKLEICESGEHTVCLLNLRFLCQQSYCQWFHSFL